MRTKNSLYNIVSNFSVFIVKTIMTFIVRAILIAKISQEYIGVNSLFTNILSILSLAELGISSAIGFSLYKPLAKNNNKEISALMAFYKKAYNIIGVTIFIIGLGIIPFIPLIVKEKIDNIIIIYLLFLINSTSSYFLSYKDVLINSDQKNYLLTKINLIFTTLMYSFEILILIITKNFILYLTVQFIFTIIQRWIINKFITKKYSNVDFKSKEKINSSTKKEIFTNIKAMFYHKIGDCLINSTDNIIISSFININMVAMYSNYLLIINYLMAFSNMFYNGILASLGNLIVKETETKKEEIFNKINFLGFTIFSFSSVLLINTFNTFIKLYAGDKYILDFYTVIIIVVNFYVTGMRVPTGNMKTAAGLFDVDKYTPIIQSLINIIFSITLANYIGLNGVLIGTFISSILPSIQRPFLVYKHILKSSCKKYFYEYIKNCIITLLIALITFKINSLINISSILSLFIVKATISSMIYIAIYIVIFHKKNEFQYYKNLIKSAIKRS